MSNYDDHELDDDLLNDDFEDFEEDDEDEELEDTNVDLLDDPDAEEAEELGDTPNEDAPDAEEAEEDAAAAGQDTDKQNKSGGQDGEDGAEDAPDLQDTVPIAKHTHEKRTRRKLEKVKDKLEGELATERQARQAEQQELARLRQQVEYAKASGAEIPDVPTAIDMQGIQDMEPDALRDTIFIQQQQLDAMARRIGMPSEGATDDIAAAPGTGADNPPGDSATNEPPTEAELDAHRSAQINQVADTAPPDSLVHELAEWFDPSGDDFQRFSGVRKTALSINSELFHSDPKYQADPQLLLTETVRQVKARLAQKVERDVQQAQQRKKPTSPSLTQAGGAAISNKGSIADRYLAAGDNEVAFLATLSQDELDELERELGDF